MPETLERIIVELDGNPLDFLFIDGDHYGVEQDYMMYAPLVRAGGIVSFHDIVSGPKENVGVVPAYWMQVKQGRDTLEIVESWSQGGWGIGVIRV